MAKTALISLIKPIEATKLNPRNGLPLGGPDVTVFFGSLIEYVGPDHDRERFKYLNELYSCKREMFQNATGGAAVEVDAPVPAMEKVAPAPEPEPVSGPVLAWSAVRSSAGSVSRASVPGGWLVSLHGTGVAFVPDPKHQWDGGSAE